MASAALFIDNSNFYHALKDSRRLPFPASDYDKLFAELSKLKFHINKIFLYDAVKDVSKEPKQYIGQQQFHAAIRKLSPKWPIEIKTLKLHYKSNDHNETWEKGLDVHLVVDAIKTALKKEAETIIILSGDADFVPAVKFIREEFKLDVVNLHLYSGSSTELRCSCNRHILVDFNNSGDIILK